MQRDIVTADSTFFTIQGILSALPSNTPQVYFSPVFWVPPKLPLVSTIISVSHCLFPKEAADMIHFKHRLYLLLLLSNWKSFLMMQNKSQILTLAHKT